MEQNVTRENILNAARELFELKGFDRTTVREVAAKAKANVALISYYFGSKESLMEALVEKMTAQIEMRLTDIHKSGEDSKGKLWLAVDFYVDRLHSNCDYYQMMHRELSAKLRPELYESIARILKRNKEALRRIFLEGQEAGQFRADVDIDLTISTIFGLMYQTTHPEFRKKVLRPNEDDESFRTRIKQHILDILTKFLLK